MGADAMQHSQTIRWSSRSPAEEEEEGLEEPEWSGMYQENTKSTDQESWALKEIREPVGVRPQSSAYMLTMAE